MNATDREQRHQARMQRKKAVIDAAIERADRDHGLPLVLTGNGKGKSSSAFGVVARTLGHGMKAGVAQFIKGRSDTGEEGFFRRQPGVVWHVLGGGFTWETQNLCRDTETARRAWAVARKLLRDPGLGLVVLDELTYPLEYGWLDIAAVLDDLAARPSMQHVEITGRTAPEALREAADTVTELRDVKRAFRAGIRAQKRGGSVNSSRHCLVLFIAAPASGQGKTTVTAALARRYRDQGLRVRVFKTGLDFLDP